MAAVFRILLDVIAYRIRRREMANLASSLTIMLAVGLAVSDVAVRFIFALALNIAVYLTNDIYDVRADLTSTNKDTSKAKFLQSNRLAAWIAVWVPIALMASIGATWDRGLLATLVVAVGACWAYSALLKRVAFIDLATILVCGVAGSMVAFPLDLALGWCLAGLLGLFAACFQTVQMVRDHDEDAAFGTRTTAVVLGPRATIALQRVLLVATATYATLVVHRWVGAAMVLVALLPFRKQEANLHWNRIRLTLGVAWLVIVVWVRFTQSTYGLCVQVDHSVLWPALSLP